MDSQKNAWSMFCLLLPPVKGCLYFLSDECNSIQYALTLKHHMTAKWMPKINFNQGVLGNEMTLFILRPIYIMSCRIDDRS